MGPAKMRLTELIHTLECTVKGTGDPEVRGVFYDSRKVEKGGIFAAIPGEHTDGHQYIKGAVEKGASCVLAERETLDITVPQVIVKDIRAGLSKISDVFYGEPSKRLTMIGVTGTNGKTTTTFLLEGILKEAGFNPGVIGTVNYRYNGNIFEAPHTTPQSPDLHKILREMADRGVTHCVMEVSSHSLEQKRVADCRFNAGVFTNLTHDHLDYHKTMDEYFRCKAMLFQHVRDAKGASATNFDDSWGRIIKKDFPETLTYSLRDGSDIYPKEYSLLEGGIEALIKTPEEDLKISSHLVGEYNLQNILAALSVCYGLKVDGEAIRSGLQKLKRVPGRLEKIEVKGKTNFRAYVDYAHTGDALERALEALGRVAKGRIITVFGCGGNRDRLKRPKMGEISTRLSTITIVTSDNPRDEEPLEIIKEIEAGIKGVKKLSGTLEGNGYTVIPDRREAIKKAVSIAKDGDTVLVAGKGHEDYQIIKGKKYHFDDFEEISTAVKELYGEGALD